MQQSTIPNIKWAQRKERLFITIDVVNVTNPVIDIIDGKQLKFVGTADTHKYALDLELFDEVDKAESKYSFDGRNIFLNLAKTTKGPYWSRLTKEQIKYNHIAIDWGHYVDEDEEEEKPMPQFGNEQGFPGMGGMGDEELGDLDEDDIPVNEGNGHSKDLNDLDAEEN